MKRYMNWALIYAVLGLVGGVFFREFTKFYNFRRNNIRVSSFALFSSWDDILHDYFVI